MPANLLRIAPSDLAPANEVFWRALQDHYKAVFANPVLVFKELAGVSPHCSVLTKASDELPFRKQREAVVIAQVPRWGWQVGGGGVEGGASKSILSHLCPFESQSGF